MAVAVASSPDEGEFQWICNWDIRYGYHPLCGHSFFCLEDSDAFFIKRVVSLHSLL